MSGACSEAKTSLSFISLPVSASPLTSSSRSQGHAIELLSRQNCELDELPHHRGSFMATQNGLRHPCSQPCSHNSLKVETTQQNTLEGPGILMSPLSPRWFSGMEKAPCPPLEPCSRADGTPTTRPGAPRPSPSSPPTQAPAAHPGPGRELLSPDGAAPGWPGSLHVTDIPTETPARPAEHYSRMKESQRKRQMCWPVNSLISNVNQIQAHDIRMWEFVYTPPGTGHRAVPLPRPSPGLPHPRDSLPMSPFLPPHTLWPFPMAINSSFCKCDVNGMRGTLSDELFTQEHAIETI
nr:histone-lysine N-methyltransferase 2D-like isoform X1 [Pan troglodytes]